MEPTFQSPLLAITASAPEPAVQYPPDHNTNTAADSSPIAPRTIHALASHLADDFPTADTSTTSSSPGRVHSIFTHAINIDVGDTLLTLCDDPSAGIPDSVVLAPADFARLHLRCDDPVRITRRQLLFTPDAPATTTIALTGPNNDNRFPSAVPLASPAVLQQRLDAIATAFLADHRLPAAAEERIPLLLAAIAIADHAACETHLRAIIGLGSGLTPATDDAILGLLAVRAFVTTASNTAHPTPAMPLFPALVARLATTLTTAVSHKYLRCAAQGRFALPLIYSVLAIMATSTPQAAAPVIPPDLPDCSALQRLVATGHSSGRDTLRGIVLTLWHHLNATNAQAAPHQQ